MVPVAAPMYSTFLAIKMAVSLYICLIACILPHCIEAQGVDLTLVPRASGSDVVNAVVSKIEASHIFPTDHRLLRRIAYVESKDGEDQNTYRQGYFGGIWQMDRLAFADTLDTSSHPALVNKFAAIEESFGIDWRQVVWEDLLRPLYSGLAARLFLSNIAATIPLAGNTEEQAAYWKTHYNTEQGAGTQERFIDDVMTLERLEGILINNAKQATNRIIIIETCGLYYLGFVSHKSVRQ